MHIHLHRKISCRIATYLAILSALAIIGCGRDDGSATVPESSDVSPQFFSVVTFGDSLSDSGNIKYLTEKFAGDSSPLLKRSIPIEPKDNNAGYYHGRFSNGPNWIDYMMTTLKLSVESPKKCFFMTSSSSCNYAVGGSTTDENLTSDTDPLVAVKNLFKDTIVETILKTFKVPQHVGMQQMVSTYLNNIKPNPNIMTHTLYVIWGGGNDYFSNETPETTVSNLISMIKDILDYKADHQIRYFLIPNLPDINKIPYVAQANIPSFASLSSVIAEHNRLLKERLESEILSNPSYAGRVVIIQVDMNKGLGDLYQNPGKYHFTNVNDPCYQGGYLPGQEGSACKNPENYLFWDSVHPTTRVHCYAAKAALSALNDEHLILKPDAIDHLNCE